MITCDLRGGLGNQLFEIFTTISYAIKHNIEFKFLNKETLGGDGCTLRYTFWNTFLSYLKLFLISELPNNMKIIEETGFPYNKLEIEQNIQEDIIIYGYFQSYKYFEEYYDKIIQIINLEGKKVELKAKLKLTDEYFENKISMHFRIGDYKEIQYFHPLATYNFYENSISKIVSLTKNESFTILYFCEDEDLNEVLNIVKRLEQVYPNYKFTRDTNHLTDWEQMLLMSLCHHNIIANSSFSWWGAYFNSNIDKIICYPSIWFGTIANIDTKDLCPPEWIRVNV